MWFFKEEKFEIQSVIIHIEKDYHMNQNPQKLSLEMSIIQSHCVIPWEWKKNSFCYKVQMVLQLR